MRTCVRMTSKGSLTGQLQRALAAGDVLAVRSLAGELPEVPLTMAAEITLLLLEREPEAYAPAARRWLARLGERAIGCASATRRRRGDPRRARGRPGHERAHEAAADDPGSAATLRGAPILIRQTAARRAAKGRPPGCEVT